MGKVLSSLPTISTSLVLDRVLTSYRKGVKPRQDIMRTVVEMEKRMVMGMDMGIDMQKLHCLIDLRIN